MIPNATKRWGVLSGALCGLCFLAFCGMLYFTAQKSARYTAALRERAAQGVSAEEAGALAQLLAATAAERAELAEYVLTDETLVGFLSGLETRVRAAGADAQVRSLSVAPLESTEQFEQLTLEVQVTGSFEAVTWTLALLQTLPYQSRIAQADISRRGQDGADLWRATYLISITKRR